VYKRTDSGCIVYSIGMNQKDDGGRFSGSMDVDEDDLAFQLFNPELRNESPDQSDDDEWGE
jgi:hypothetical protein